MNNIFMEDQEEYKLQGHMDFRGLVIDIENKKGSIRSGKNPDGTTWETKMSADYGRIRNTSTSSDDEEMDVYVLSNKTAEYVYQVSQMKSPDFEEFDEFKYILGANSETDAVELYLRQYDDERFFGGIKEIPFKDFKEKIDEYISRSHTKPEVNEIFSKWSHIISR